MVGADQSRLHEAILVRCTFPDRLENRFLMANGLSRWADRRHARGQRLYRSVRGAVLIGGCHANAADAGTLEVTVTQQLVKKPITRTFSIKPGSESTVDLPIGVYSVQAVGSASSTPLVSATIGAENQAAELQYFVGSASNGSLSMVTRIVPDVF